MRKTLIPILLIPLVLASCGKSVDSLTEVTKVLEDQGLECVNAANDLSSSWDSSEDSDGPTVTSAYTCEKGNDRSARSSDIRSVVALQVDGKIKDMIESEGDNSPLTEEVGMRIVYGKNWLAGCSDLRDCEAVKKEVGGTLAKVSADGSLEKID